MAEINLGRVVGSDASVTKVNIENALGFEPADNELIGLLASLTTEQKDNLVAAINEVNDGLSSHEAESVQQNEVHGLKIESGTWTPVLAGHVVAGEHTYTGQGGTYYKVGKMVVCSCILRLSKYDVTAQGAKRIIGLPFAIKMTSGSSIAEFHGIELSEGYTQLLGYGLSNYVQLMGGGSDKNSDYNPVILKDNLRVTFTIVYEIN